MIYLEATMILIAGIGALLVGMGILSDNMKRFANTRLEGALNKISDSKIKGFGVGVATTAVVQSSGVTTVMVVGLVNAGVISLLQATTIIMGANVGTTITAQIAALQSFNFVIFAMVFAFIGSFVDLFFKKEKLKTIGRILQGLGLIFVGFYLLGDAMNVFKSAAFVINLLANMKNPFLLLLIGIVLTAIFQSSSAITAIIISMVIAGIVIGGGGNASLYIILGSNIGTTIVAWYASLGANVNAKRASLIHILFNLTGSLIFMVFLLLWPSFNDVVLKALFLKEATQIAMFHTFFNLACALMFLPFSAYFVKVSEKLIKVKDQDKRATIVLEERLLNSPSLAIPQLKKELVVIAGNAMNCLRLAFNSFLFKDLKKEEAINDCIKNGSNLTQQTIEYLIKLSGQRLSRKEKIITSKLFHAINDVERISDLASNLIKYTKTCLELDLVFTEAALKELESMFVVMENLFIESMAVFITSDKEKYLQVEFLEDSVDRKRKEIVDSHIKRLNEGKCRPESSPILINLVANLERAADHLHYIAKEFVF